MLGQKLRGAVQCGHSPHMNLACEGWHGKATAVELGSAVSFFSEWKREAEKDKGNATVQGVSGLNLAKF